jgi:beta-aspartyl-peptidase (threonine type)
MLRPILRIFALSLMALIGALQTPAFAKDKSITPAEYYRFGSISGQAPSTPSSGLLLMGGGDRNIDALKWFFAKSGGGHIVVLSASYGKEIGEEFYNEVGGIRSVQIFVLHDRSQSTNRKLLKQLRRADGIFFAGGDQSRYIRYWRGTPVHAAVEAHLAAGKPIGGTSAGLAILGEKIYGAMDDGSINTAEALADPFGPANTIEGDFIQIPHLEGVITDTHFKERDRLGRLFAFVAKAQTTYPDPAPNMIGLGVDESAALAVEADGTARIHATESDGYAWVVHGEALKNLPQSGPLQAANVRVDVVGKDSVLHLPSGRVDAPLFSRLYSAQGGEIHENPK